MRGDAGARRVSTKIRRLFGRDCALGEIDCGPDQEPGKSRVRLITGEESDAVERPPPYERLAPVRPLSLCNWLRYCPGERSNQRRHARKKLLWSAKPSR